MKSEQKKRIKQLRDDGYSYGKISKLLGIPVSTIKSHCQKNAMGGTTGLKKDLPGYCRYCGRRLAPSPQLAVKRFCSSLCRETWWKEHPGMINRKAVHKRNCIHCNTEFTCYINSKKKYCSLKCAAIHRYHGKDGGGTE